MSSTGRLLLSIGKKSPPLTLRRAALVSSCRWKSDSPTSAVDALSSSSTGSTSNKPSPTSSYEKESIDVAATAAAASSSSTVGITSQSSSTTVAATTTTPTTTTPTQHMEALSWASASRPRHVLKPIACELELNNDVALTHHYYFDKVLLLMKHGEDQSQVGEDSDRIRDPSLTGLGFGQALTMSQTIATNCTKELGLQPELIVVSPLSRVLQTTLLAFPLDTPASSVRNNTAPWICHEALLEESSCGDVSNEPASAEELELTLPGMDYTAYNMEGGKCLAKTPSTLLESKEILLQKSDYFVEWLSKRKERVIVVSAQCSWLQAFCGYTLDYEGSSSEVFENGEFRVVGIHF